MAAEKDKGKAGFTVDGLAEKIEDIWNSFGSVKYGRKDPASRTFTVGSQFTLGTMAINAAQFLGAPLAFINEDWHKDWIKFNKQQWALLITTMTHWWSPTLVRVCGDKSVRGQLSKSADGQLVCNFSERMMLIANHQIYTDWLYLWYIGYAAGLHGQIHIVMKESLKKLPFVGWGMTLSKFIFLKRHWEQDKAGLAQHLQTLNNPDEPMWLMFFPEGTNLAPSTREKSKSWADKNGIKDMQHVLLPRSTGLQFCLQKLRGTVDYVYDCTIAYEGVRRREYAQDIYTFQSSWFSGKPPKSVNMHWRRFKISAIPLDDLVTFDLWLRDRWAEKDALMEYYMQKGRFPADIGSDNLGEGGQRRQGAGYIETEVKPNNWYEILQVFAPIASIAIVLYYFYNKTLPTNLFDTATDWAGYNEEDIKKLLRVGPAPKLGKPKTVSSQAFSSTLKPPNVQRNRNLTAETPRTLPVSQKSSLNGSAIHTKPASTRAASISGQSLKGAPSVVSNADSIKTAGTQKPAKLPPLQKVASTRAASVSGTSLKGAPSVVSNANSVKTAATQKPAKLPTSAKPTSTPAASVSGTSTKGAPAATLSTSNAPKKIATPQKIANLPPTATAQKATDLQKGAADKTPAPKSSSVNENLSKKATDGVTKHKAPAKDKVAKKAPTKSPQVPSTLVNKDPEQKSSTKKAASKAVPSKDMPTKKNPTQDPPTKRSQSNEVPATRPRPKPKPNVETSMADKNVSLKKKQIQTTPRPPEKPTPKPLAPTNDAQKATKDAVATKPLSKTAPTPKPAAKKEAVPKSSAPAKTEPKGPSTQPKQVAWSETTDINDPWSERPSGKRLVKAQPTRKDRVKVAKKMQRQHLDHVAA